MGNPDHTPANAAVKNKTPTNKPETDKAAFKSAGADFKVSPDDALKVLAEAVRHLRTNLDSHVTLQNAIGTVGILVEHYKKTSS